MKLENEKALIRTIAEGNTKSFEVLFYSYYPRLKGFICDLLQSPEEAEDISQDILAQLQISVVFFCSIGLYFLV